MKKGDFFVPFIAMGLFFFVLLFFFATYYPFRRTFGCGARERRENPVDYMRDPPESADYPGHIKLIERVCAETFERVQIRSADGLRLSARYYAAEEGAPVVLFFHGYRSNAVHDGCGMHYIARRLGYHILLCDQRAHGESEGRALSFGVFEREDARLWAEYASKRFPASPIFLSGISMGGATVLMAASMPLPENVVGILADCPYSSPKEIIKKVIRDLGMPAGLVYPLVRLGAILYGGFDPNSVDAVSSVQKKTPPILLAHGTADTFVPVEMSERIAAAASAEHRLILVEGANHGKGYTVAPQIYTEAVREFFDRNLQKKP